MTIEKIVSKAVKKVVQVYNYITYTLNPERKNYAKLDTEPYLPYIKVELEHRDSITDIQLEKQVTQIYSTHIFHIQQNCDGKLLTDIGHPIKIKRYYLVSPINQSKKDFSV